MSSVWLGAYWAGRVIRAISFPLRLLAKFLATVVEGIADGLFKRYG